MYMETELNHESDIRNEITSSIMKIGNLAGT